MARKRVRAASPPPAVREARKADRARGKAGETSKGWSKKGLVVLVVVLLLAPFSLMKLHEIAQHLVHAHRLSVPFFADLGRPADFSLNHTVNTYITPEKGISLGLWLTVPESLWEEAQGKDLAWYQSRLGDGRPVFIYLHGNTGTRAAPHRVGVAKMLSALNYHVVVPEYRGFGDSSGEPTEAGMTADALFVYDWVRTRCGSCQVIIWGHSLGTGVTTNTASKLAEDGVFVDGIILEGIFNVKRLKPIYHPFSWYYWKFPGMSFFFPEPWAENKLVFPTEENLKKIKSPIQFLHSEDDVVTPIHLAQELYELAVDVQSSDRVRMAKFEGSLGYLHNGLYRDARLPDIIRSFVSSL